MVWSRRILVCLRSFHRHVASSSRFSHRNVLKLSERQGFVSDVFPLRAGNELAAFLEKEPRCFYAGFDPTADSLHVGNLMILMAMLHAQRSGHQVLAVIGGGTAKIGDPSGKSKERPAMDDDTIQKNVAGVTADIEKVFENHERLFWKNGTGSGCLKKLKVLNNEEWYQNLGLIDFLRTTGRMFRMGKMLSRENVKRRLEDPAAAKDPQGGLSFAEFSYQIFQAYDWQHLYRNHECSVQIGGSDQMGNIACGHEFLAKSLDDVRTNTKNVKKKHSINAYGILLPLLTTENGTKFGKSESGGQVWLSGGKTSPFEFYQFFLRLPDSQVEKMLNHLTLFPVNEICDVMAAHEKNSETRLPHKKLASFLTLLVHGNNGLDLAQKTTDVLYHPGDDIGTKLARLTQDELKLIFSQAKHHKVLFHPGIMMLDFASKLGCFRSEKDAQRVVAAGGFYVNQVRRTNIDEVLVPGDHLLPSDLTVVRVGKKDYHIVEWVHS